MPTPPVIHKSDSVNDMTPAESPAAMTRKKLSALVRSFASYIMVFSAGSSSDMCFMVCSPLCGYLKFLGVDARMVEGFVGKSRKHHWWIETKEGLCIDPTADQFTENPLPRTYVGPRPLWYRVKKQRGLCNV